MARELENSEGPMSWWERVMFVALFPVFFMLWVFASLMIMASSGLAEWFEDDDGEEYYE